MRLAAGNHLTVARQKTHFLAATAIGWSKGQREKCKKIMLIGYLGKDVELRYAGSNTVIATFSVASTERWKDGNGDPKEHTEWFNIKAFDRRAEIAGSTFTKPRAVT